MKIILAPDKFKGSLTGLEFCYAVEEGIKKVNPQLEILKLPLADGGDGTIEVVSYYLKGNMITKEVSNPFFNPIKASYLFADSSKIAFIEMAEASGVKILNSTELDCKNATTLGTGELILDAIEKGAKKIILGIGGSATNDCGIGMATALGYRFFDNYQKELKPLGKNLSKIVSIDESKINPKLKQIDFRIACDVTNPLYGKNGAAYVYAKQKGATLNDIKMLDEGLQCFAKVLDAHFNIKSQEIKGAGAAGGMGIGAKTFLNGKLIPGIDLIKDLSKFDKNTIGADWIITGEGQLDDQTFSGKTINGVMNVAKKQNIKVAALCGKLDLNKELLIQYGISYADAVMNYTNNFDDAMTNSSFYISKMAEKFAKRL